MAQAFVPTTYIGADARCEASARKGEYVAAVFDIDAGNIPADRLAKAVEDTIPGASYLIYTTYTSAPENLRWRVPVPLVAVDYDYFRAVSLVISNALAQALGVTPDQCTMRGRQIAFVPNANGHAVTLFGKTHLPPLDWRNWQHAEFVESARAKLRMDDEEHARSPLPADRGDAPPVVQQFNETYPIWQILEQCGYEESPRMAPAGCSDWRSPYQTSGTYATRVYEDGRWVSLSGSDFDNEVGPNNGKYCYGDAYDLWAHYSVRRATPGMTREQSYARGMQLLRETPVQVEQSVSPAPAVEVKDEEEFLGIAPAPLSDAAKIGLVGALLFHCAGKTEATEAGIVFQFLPWAGTMLSGHRFIDVGGRQYTNLFTTVVGRTGEGLKTTANTIVRDLFAAAYPGSLRLTTSNVASGEGILHAIRDRRLEQVVGDDGEIELDRFGDPVMRVVDGEEIRDKRFLINAAETSALFATMGREGNTLSAILREAWDGNKISITRRDGGKGGDVATDPHIGLCGSITPAELQGMRDKEKHNGFANRVLMAHSHSKTHIDFPEPIRFVTGYGLELANWLAGVLTDPPPFGNEYIMTAEARAYWSTPDGETDPAKFGLSRRLKMYPKTLAHFLERQRPQCLRVAMIYAALDRKHMIDVPHLRAAEEIIRYARDTVLMQFGAAEQLSDDALYILKVIKEAGADGIARGVLQAKLRGGWTTKRIDPAITALSENDRISVINIPRPGGKGRGTITYLAIDT